MHSVCVPCPCGLKKILLKLVELPSETFPTHSPNFTGSISGFSIYHAIGFASVLVNGIEISMGFYKSISNVLLIFAFIIPNLAKTNHLQFRHLKTFHFYLCAGCFHPQK